MSESQFWLTSYVQKAVTSISHPADKEVCLLLLNTGPLSFDDIKERQGRNSNEIRRSLNVLMEGGLVFHEYKKLKGDRRHSFYVASELARDLFLNLMNMQQPSMIITNLEGFYVPGSKIQDLYNTISDIRQIGQKPVQLVRDIRGENK